MYYNLLNCQYLNIMALLSRRSFHNIRKILSSDLILITLWNVEDFKEFRKINIRENQQI